MKVRGCRVQSHERDITNPQRGKLVQQSYRFEAGPTACKMSKGDRSVTLDVVKNSLWVDVQAYMTAEGARNADARLVAQVVDGLPEELPSSPGPTTPSFPDSSDSSSPVEDMRTRLRVLRAQVWVHENTHMWRRALEREVTERRHLEEEALLD